MPAFIVVGLGYGDEGKGAVVDHLVRQHKAGGVVLFNGGAQRAHNVVTPDGRHHTFSQISSGTFAGAQTYLSKHSLVNPHALFLEAQQLQKDTGINIFGQISVQKGALVTTPFHVALNRFRERARGNEAHGTCGMGIGETVLDANNGYALRVEDFGSEKVLYEKLHDCQTRLRKAAHVIAAKTNSNIYVTDPTFWEFAAIKDCMEIYRIFSKLVPMFEEFSWDSDETVVFEGGQGALLHEYHGFHPHTTWSDTSAYNAIELLGPEALEETKIIGVMRSYMTRHGAGPFVTEDPGLAERFPEAHNGHGEWQGSWRVGWTDLAAIKYGMLVSEGIDELAITHLDRVQDDWKICLGYKYGNDPELLEIPFRNRQITREQWELDQKIFQRQMAEATPEYVEFDKMDADTFLAYAEGYLNVPITITGHGPTRDDYRAAVPA